MLLVKQLAILKQLTIFLILYIVFHLIFKIIYKDNKIIEKNTTLSKDNIILLKDKENLNLEIENLKNELKIKTEELKKNTETLLEKEKKLSILENEIKWVKSQSQSFDSKIQIEIGKYLDERERKNLELNNLRLNSLLSPLKENIEKFQKSISTYFQDESKERFFLSSELQKLQKMNEQLSEEAHQLTLALKNDNKIQGSWGELILEKALEASGLRKGIEYRTQVSLISSDGVNRLQPDVLINLPYNKSLIIDSKVSLTSYTKYYNSTDERERVKNLNDHIQSIKTHIKKLSKKNYKDLPQLETLDFVLLFIPIESAFSLLINNCPNIIQDAQEDKIMLVTPSTLMITLKTIYLIWQHEKSNQNAKILTKNMNSIYNKFKLFTKSCISLGEGIKKTNNEYEIAMNRLMFGKGNLLTQMENFNKFEFDGNNKDTEIPVINS